MGSILTTAAAFLRNQAFLWEKKEISQKAKQFQKIIDTLTLNWLKYPQMLNTSMLEQFKSYWGKYLEETPNIGKI